MRFEGYVLDRARWQLRYGDELLPLNRKTFDLLLYLIEHADEVVSKEELLHALWPESFVEENNLTQQIFMLRRALSRHESGTRIIETTPGRGYRFSVAVSFEPRPGPQEATQPSFVAHASDLTVHIVTEREEDREHSSSAHAQGSSSDASGAMTNLMGATATPFSSQRLLDRSTDPNGTRWLPWSVFIGILLTLSLVASLRNSKHLSISTYTRITHDGHAKFLGGTDGSRIYFTRPEKSGIWQVSTSGGPEAPLPIAINDPWSGDVSPGGSTLLIISQEAGQGPATSLWTYHLVGRDLRRLTNAISSAWSPDGVQIAYASANGDLFVMRHDGSESRRIGSPGGYISSLAWSPDGATIRFSRDGFLWQVSPDGSHLVQFLPGWGKAPTQWSGGWARDGSFFFVADGQIWSIEKQRHFGTNSPPKPVQLTFGPVIWDRPVPGADGNEIFASGRTRRGELVRYHAPTRKLTPFLAGISAEFVTFPTSAKSVAYVSYPEGILWRANPDGSNPVQLTEPRVHPKSVCWSPDGSQIAFVNRTADNIDAIFVVASDGTGKPRRLLEQDREAETDPSWSPDGRKLVFSTSRNVGASAKSDLRILDLATGKAIALPGSDGLLVPRWSPGGDAIAAMTLDTEHLELFHVSDQTWTPLDTGAVAFPEWSHDGRWIYYVRWTVDPAVLRIRVADGKRQAIADLKGVQYTGTYTLWMGLDRTDHPMMLRDQGTDDIYALTLDRR